MLRESGGHRYQRVPPTERNGRVHTSTVTVAVFEFLPATVWKLRDADIEILITKGTGPGGMNRNRRETAIVMRHRPTGIEAKAECERTQGGNRRIARETLEARVAAHTTEHAKTVQDASRRGQVGSGMRGDKIRTYREQDDSATDHRGNAKVRLSRIRAGYLDLLFPRA